MAAIGKPVRVIDAEPAEVPIPEKLPDKPEEAPAERELEEQPEEVPA